MMPDPLEELGPTDLEGRDTGDLKDLLEYYERNHRQAREACKASHGSMCTDCIWNDYMKEVLRDRVQPIERELQRRRRENA